MGFGGLLLNSIVQTLEFFAHSFQRKESALSDVREHFGEKGNEFAKWIVCGFGQLTFPSVTILVPLVAAKMVE